MSVATPVTANGAAATAHPVMEGRGLSKSFLVKRGQGLFARRVRLQAVDDVSISLDAGSVIGLVGESGSGKTTVVRMFARIILPDSGEIRLGGQPVPSGRPRDYTRQVQMVFQDPFASLNPVHRVRHHLLRPLEIHDLTGGDAEAAIGDLLRRVALDPPSQYVDKFPHELSGGQRQRVAIARTLAVRPRVLLADEPVSMLDVSIRLGVLNLLADLRDREHLAILYVTHDIASARYLADSIAVMYAGKVVEYAPSADLTDRPAHPYTQLLLSAAPDPDRTTPPTLAGSGAPPSLVTRTNACLFHPRCPHAMDICRRATPPSVSVAPGHAAACWLHVDPADRRADETTKVEADAPAVAEPNGRRED
jgi:peptide/nickel transport system ATP-binding protein